MSMITMGMGGIAGYNNILFSTKPQQVDFTNKKLLKQPIKTKIKVVKFNIKRIDT